MIVDGVRWLVETLAAPGTGVNAQLPNVPRDNNEPPPAEVEIFNEIDHEWVGRGEVPRKLYLDDNGDPRSMLVVRMHPDEKGFLIHTLPEYERPDPNILPFVVMFIRRKVEKPNSTITVDSQIRDARQTMRTVIRVLAQQFESTQSAQPRGVCQLMLTAAGFTLNSQFVDVTDDLVADTLVVPLRVLDKWALGLPVP